MLTSNLFLISLGVLILVVCVVLGAVVYFAAHGAQNKPTAERKIVRLRSDSLRNAFRHAVELIEGNIASRAERYNIPWIMVLSEGDDTRPLPISQAGVASVLSAEAASSAATQGISWHFFDRGIVIDIKAAYLGSPDDEADEKPWDEFLTLCRSYRPQRPFDSVVITVPAATLLADNTDARLELVRHAKLAHRRLWLAQNRFAMRFAVYVVVTGCEALTGFAAFARALPEPLRASMLGWSSPHDLSTTYQADWIETAMNSIMRSVSDTSAELFTLDTGDLDARESLLLPSRIDAMREQLQLYVDELLRPSAYHEPFFFRGIYLTGDSGELAQLGADQRAAAEDRDEQMAEALDDPYGDREPSLAMASSSPAYASGEEDSPISELMLQPAFLRDLFDKKIFLEYGLTRPSRSQHLTRPVLHRAMRWGGIILISGWGLGLVVATFQLNHRNAELVAALGELHANAQERAAAAQSGQDLPPDWYRRKALALISLNDRLRMDTAWTIFMPGAWSAVDDLDDRVKDRFEHEFGEIAVTALEREMYARVSQLTGVVRDPSTGQLIIGDDCASPLSASGSGGVRTSDSVAVDDVPEMTALQRYVGAVDQFNTALQAMQRLQRPSSDNAEALRQVVRYAFGAELQGNVSGSLPYFYRNTVVDGVHSTEAVIGLNMPVLRQALSCTFDKGAQQLDDRLFTNNALLSSERSVSDHLTRLAGTDAGASDFPQLVGNYRAVVTGINAQQELLASGKGAWMHQAQFSLGPVYDRTMARAAQSPLLGADLVAHARDRSSSAFQAFRSEMALRFGGPDGGVIWLDKDAHYAVAPARLALRDSLANLLNQPFMADPRDVSLPALPDGATIVWDHAQLDQALALGDVRKHFLTDGLANLPASLRPAIEQALDAQFARLLLNQTAAAATVTFTQGEPDTAGFEAARTRLFKIGGILTDMGASTQLDDLNRFVSSDALANLHLVDDELTQSELYATRATGASGGPRTVLTAFGIADASALGAYLDQQSVRALALGKQAAVYLAALDSTDATDPLAQRWQAIDRDLDRYQLKNPNSSLLMLEQFVLSVAADTGTSNCLAKFPPRPFVNGADDYFSEIHLRLYNSLLARCSQGDMDVLRQQWDSFSTAFNDGVAGRQPFRASSRGAQADAGAADVGQLGQVLQRYDHVSGIVKQARAGAAQGVQLSAPVRQFIDNFDQVDALLAPLYPATDGTATGYDISVDFRVNRVGEVAANQVIDWTLQVGDQTLSLNDAPHPLHWDYGMPVSLVLRFAKDSPLTAMNDPQQRALSTDGRTLTWQFADPWALLSFISQQRVPDGGLRGSATAQMLRFEFPLGALTATDQAQLPKQAHGRVFLRMTLMAAGKKIPLPWPGSFPSRAPDWSAL
jgi:type VI secretion system protein ImpL